MYQTLYRKYRPNTFDDVVGQEMIVRTLKNEIENNHINHAYLFTGPRGTGKTSIAKLFAKAINCESLVNMVPCDKCVSCTQINNKQSTDIIEIDAASNNGVDEIRELKSKVNLVPGSSKYKIYIIDEVHMLTVGAFNALLKTLEEPPAHIIFILATTDPHKIPLTILSRCQRFDFKKIGISKIVNRLKYITVEENILTEDETLNEIARLSDGGLRDALSLFDQALSYADEKITISDVHEVNGTLSHYELSTLIDNLLAGNLGSILDELNHYDESGKNFTKLTEEIIYFLRNMLLMKIVPEYSKEHFDSENYTIISQKIESSTLLSMIEVFNQSLSDLKYTNNEKLMMELAIIKILSTKESKSEVKEKILKNNEDDNFQISSKVDSKVQLPVKSISEINDIKTEEPKETIKKTELNPISVETISSNNPENSIKEEENDFAQFKKRRINNTLSGFNRKLLIEMNEMMDDLKSLLINPECSEYVSILLDGTLKAVGNNYMIFIYDTERIAEAFNRNIPKIEEIIENDFQEKYHVIATDTSDWNRIKVEFNEKKKQYIFEEELPDIMKIFNKKEEVGDDIHQLFGNIVEYK